MAVLHPYIAIEGVIGAGKTSLATMLAKTYNAKLLLENFDDNPFLERFYKEPDKYAFALEMSFMAERFQQLKDHLIAPDLFHERVVADYITEKSVVFASKTLPDDIFILYKKMFNIVFSNIPKPDLLVYLYASPERLLHNIAVRGRDFEKNIAADYLKDLQEGYIEYIKNIKDTRTLIIDINNIDFVNNPDDYNRLCDAIFKEYPIGVNIENFV
ncbi:hypothetical protein FACS1894153_0770 [Bacteroidia bacterium]|nr:hypothetical protein FACS1894153_0770 [Bacteroidia bacterium]